ncbi:MAG: YHS domain-containing (seleno)protein [Stappiaceae bacterium]
MISISAGAQERFVSDPTSGLALSGYDPVAYFVDRRARPGKTAHELTWMGVSWRFVNKGNMYAFKDTPKVYAPQYGGHGAFMAAQGYTTGGNPEVWTIYRQKLYVFYSPANRFSWFADPYLFTRKADELFIPAPEGVGN